MHVKRLFSSVAVLFAVGFCVGVLVSRPIVAAGSLPDQADAVQLPVPTDPDLGSNYTSAHFAPDLQAYPTDFPTVAGESRTADPRKVPEPATMVSLAGLAAMAGISLLLRVRWFRRR